MGQCCDGKFDRKQWFILAVIGSVHFGSAICISLQAPFYPKEAESKNATATEYGFVFGIFELVSFISSPILGNFMDIIGAKIVLNTGIFTAAISCICFGLLGLIQDRVTFIALSFVVRIAEALGSAAAVTSAFAITAASFPDNVATTFATLEIFYGLGYIVGPIVGSILYSIGGYMLPFIVMGSLLLVVAVIIFFCLPSFSSDAPRTKGRILDIIKVPAVLLDSISIMSVSICVGYYTATLEPHIRSFELNAVAVGFVFVVQGATYAATAPFVGRLNDTIANPRYMILIGSILTVASVFLVGPAPFIPVQKSLPLVLCGLVCLGLAMSSSLVSAFIDGIQSAIGYGFPDDISTYALVSGLWAASFSLGDFIGPSVAGFLDDQVGFQKGSMFIVAVHAVVFTAMLIFILKHPRGKYSGAPPLKVLEVSLSGTEKEKEPLNAPNGIQIYEKN